MALAMLACSPLAADPAEAVPKELRLRVEPDGSPSDVPRVARLHLEVGAEVDPDDIHIVVGDVRSAHLGQFARQEISDALAERIVPAMRWRQGGEVVLAPTQLLEPGVVHHVVLGAERLSQAITTRTDDAVPLLSHVWPRDGESQEGSVAVWCGEDVLPPHEVVATLEPGALPTQLSTGANAEGIGRSCVHLGVPKLGTEVVSPPAVLTAEGIPLARLEPVALRPAEPVEVPSALDCAEGELPLGAGCITYVADDRAWVDVAEGPRLWMVSDGRQLDLVTVRTGGALLLHPLVAATPTDLSWSTLDAAGQADSGVVRVFTRSPMAHVVITEVLANPIGPEPEQEFVELYNDGLAPADLGDFDIHDIGGITAMPAGIMLMPGRYALVVNDVYDVHAEYDPNPAPGTLIVRVGRLGNGGLKNDGEPLKLVDDDGRAVSRFPAEPKPQSGVSVHRVDPRVLVHDDDGFLRAPPTPGAPYAPAEDP